MEVSVSDMLEARDNRVLKQKSLIEKYGAPLICFTMNIAGPVKCSPLIEEGFLIGVNLLKNQLSGEGLTLLCFEEERLFTGCTAYCSVKAEASFLKKLTSEIEDSSALGRLFDMDVLDENGKKLSRTDLGLPQRKCLICQRDAMLCSSSRAHTVAELQQKTGEILNEAVSGEKAEKIAAAAVKSLLYEVCTTPKPGLVDCNNSGSHKDMDIFTFCASSSVLFPYFKDCALHGINTRTLPPDKAFKSLRFKGKQAQGKMYAATNGINTHKGAIFTLGILTCAAGRRAFEKNIASDLLLKECAEMTAGITKELTSGELTAGRKIYEKYGITGVRGQAEKGFPAVKDYGLPTLLSGVESGLSLNDAGCGALLSLIAYSDDTNIISRSDGDTARLIKEKVKSIISVSPFPDKKTLCELDKYFTDKNVSAGGSADLLAACYFLYFLTK